LEENRAVDTRWPGGERVRVGGVCWEGLIFGLDRSGDDAFMGSGARKAHPVRGEGMGSQLLTVLSREPLRGEKGIGRVEPETLVGYGGCDTLVSHGRETLVAGCGIN
jgi:hypothetical protein